MDADDSKYRIAHALQLDDAVFWCSQPPSLQELVARVNEGPFAAELERLHRFECYCGPSSDVPLRLPLQEVREDELPIIFWLYLDADPRHITFLYLHGNIVELHLPERYFVTGDRREDRTRLSLGIELAMAISEALALSWDHFECDGRDREITSPMIAWEEFAKELWDAITLGTTRDV